MHHENAIRKSWNTKSIEPMRYECCDGFCSFSFYISFTFQGGRTVRRRDWWAEQKKMRTPNIYQFTLIMAEAKSKCVVCTQFIPSSISTQTHTRTYRFSLSFIYNSHAHNAHNYWWFEFFLITHFDAYTGPAFSSYEQHCECQYVCACACACICLRSFSVGSS